MATSVTFLLTCDAILAMPQQHRCASVTRTEAERLGLVFIDAVGGGAQFIGTQKEHDERAMSFRSIEPFRNGRAGRVW